MQIIYKCDHCEYSGSEDDVKKHEKECPYNFDKESCYTCVYAIFSDNNIPVACKNKKPYECKYVHYFKKSMENKSKCELFFNIREFKDCRKCNYHSLDKTFGSHNCNNLLNCKVREKYIVISSCFTNREDEKLCGMKSRWFEKLK